MSEPTVTVYFSFQRGVVDELRYFAKIECPSDSEADCCFAEPGPEDEAPSPTMGELVPFPDPATRA